MAKQHKWEATATAVAVAEAPPLEIPRPKITSGCFVCGVTRADIADGHVVVSPSGKAHHGEEWGNTACGKDATGDGWWWPL